MTDLAQRVDSENADGFPSLYEDKALPLYGNLPVTILVKLVQTPAGVVPGFALAEDGMPYIKGIRWHYPTDEMEYSLFITFQLAAKIIELRCDTLWYSVAQASTQRMCVRTGRATYHFDVEISNDIQGVVTIDPQIIVTPINPGTGGNDQSGEA